MSRGGQPGGPWGPVVLLCRQAQRGAGLRGWRGVPAPGQRPHPRAALYWGECAVPPTPPRALPVSPDLRYGREPSYSPGPPPSEVPPPQSRGIREGRDASPASTSPVATQVLSELLSTHHLKLSNTTEIPQYFRLLVSRPFSVAQGGASRSRSTPGPEQGCEEEQATGGKRLVLHPQENMLVSGGSAGGHRARGHPPVTHTHTCGQTCAHQRHALVHTGVQTPHTVVASAPTASAGRPIRSSKLRFGVGVPSACWVLGATLGATLPQGPHHGGRNSYRRKKGGHPGLT